MTDADRIARRARFEASRDVLEELCDGVRVYLLRQIEEASPERAADILEMHRGLNNVAKIRRAFQLVIDDGLIAESAASVVRLNRA